MVLFNAVLQQFAKLEIRASEMFEMRLVASLTNEEIVRVFEVSLTPAERDIKVVKA